MKSLHIRKRNMIVIVASVLLCGFVSGMFRKGQKWNVVHNSADPILGEERVELEEEWAKSLGDITAGEMEWIEIDHNGIIYILNARSKKIGIISPQDGVMTTFQVPREVSGFKVRGEYLHLFADDCIYLINKRGLISKSLRVPEGLISAIPTHNGKYIAMTSPRRNEYEIVLYDANGNRESVLHRYQLKRHKPALLKSSMKENYYYTGTEHEYTFHWFFCEVGDGKAIFGESGKYVLKIWDDKGNIDKEIRKTERIEKISQEEIERVIQNMEGMKTGLLGGGLSRADIIKGLVMPPHKPFFHKVFGDVDGKVYTVRIDLKLNAMMTIDIFDEEGKYIKKVKTEFFPIEKIFKGKIYGISKKTPNAIAGYRMRIVRSNEKYETS